MADSDWAKYRQIRGKALPESIDLLGSRYRLGSLLKRDFYAAVGLYQRDDDPSAGGPPARVLLKVYHTDRVRLVLFPWGALGRFLCRREAGFLAQLEGVQGIPQLLSRYGESGLVREFVPGCNLREYTRKGLVVGVDFFPRLRGILDAVHARGVSHNDLSKPENVLVTADGSPALIDFQIATRVVSGGTRLRRASSRTLIRYLQRIDRYHLTKQYSRRRPMDFSADERKRMERKGWLVTAHGWLRRPYRAVRHQILRNFLTVAPGSSAVPPPHLVDPGSAGRPAPEGVPGGVGVAEDRTTG
jgi:predicted Ser/Thr protein kinase